MRKALAFSVFVIDIHNIGQSTVVHLIVADERLPAYRHRRARLRLGIVKNKTLGGRIGKSVEVDSSVVWCRSAAQGGRRKKRQNTRWPTWSSAAAILCPICALPCHSRFLCFPLFASLYGGAPGQVLRVLELGLGSVLLQQPRVLFASAKLTVYLVSSFLHLVTQDHRAVFAATPAASLFDSCPTNSAATSFCEWSLESASPNPKVLTI